MKLDDKYTLNEGVRFLTGSQALVRLPIIQKRRDIITKNKYSMLYNRLPRFTTRWL